MDEPRTLSKMPSPRADISKSLMRIFQLNQDNLGIALENPLKE